MRVVHFLLKTFSNACLPANVISFLYTNTATMEYFGTLLQCRDKVGTLIAAIKRYTITTPTKQGNIKPTLWAETNFELHFDMDKRVK